MSIDEIRELVRKASEKHADDVDKAWRAAMKAAERHPDIHEFDRELRGKVIRDMIHDFRHANNTDIRNRLEAKEKTYGAPPKVKYGDREVTTEIHKTCYDYCINGTLLVLMTGNDLRAAANSERNIANGHLFNAVLCEELARVVPADKMVKDCPVHKKLETVFKRARRKTDIAKAG